MMADRDILSEAQMNYLRSFEQHEIGAISKQSTNFSIDLEDVLTIVFYMSKFKISDFKPFLDDISGFEYCILVVSKEGLSSPNLKAIAEHRSRNNIVNNMQVFVLSELLFNVTRHILVPKHEPVRDPAMIETIVKDYNLKHKSQFPIILRSDPVARYFDIKSGQLVKITRVSPTSGEYTFYRCCL